MLKSVDHYLQKCMPFITPTAVLIGVLFSSYLMPLQFLVPWVFAFMSFSGSLGSNFRDLKNVIRHPLPLFVCLAVLHIVMPLLSFGVGNLVFYDDPYFITGLILAFVIPTGITSLIWVSVYKGNVVLTLSIILVDMIISPFLVPAVLHLFVGEQVQMNGLDIMLGLLWMVAIPSLAGMALNQYTKGKVKKRLAPNLAPFSKIGIGIVVAINSSAVAPFFKDLNGTLFKVAIVVFLLAIVGYVIGWAVAKLWKQPDDTIVSLTYNSGMRNISAGAVIAITYFPAPVAFPVIVCMLFQQVIASITGSFLSHSTKVKESVSTTVSN